MVGGTTIGFDPYVNGSIITFKASIDTVPAGSTLDAIYLYSTGSTSTTFPVVYSQTAIINRRHVLTNITTTPQSDCTLIGAGQADECLPGSCTYYNPCIP